MNLTSCLTQDYEPSVTAKSVIGIGLLVKAAIGRKVLSNVAFLLSQCARSLWAGWAGAARPPVRFSGSPTCSVPPTLIELGVGGSFNELKSEHIMSTQSKVASARHKSKSVPHPKATYLTPGLLRQKSCSKARKEFNNFIDTATEAEMKVVGHLIVGNDPEALMKKVRRL